MGAWSFRSRLVALVLLALAPALTLMLYTAVEQRRAAIASAQDTAHALARHIAFEHQGMVEGVRQLLAGLAQIPEIRAHRGEPCSALLAAVLEQFPMYANLGAAGADGRVFCSALPVGGPVSVADRAWFERALRTGRFAAGDYQVGRITGRATINFGYPAADPMGRPSAVVFAAVDLGWLRDRLAAATLPAEMTVTVIDRGGLVLARRPDPGGLTGRAFPDAPVVRRLATLPDGVGREIGLDGVDRVFGLASLALGDGEGAPWVVVTTPVRAVVRAADMALARNVAALAAIGALALAGAWLLSEALLLKPLNALLEAVRRLRSGELGARTGLAPRSHELGRLAQAFDEMAGALERLTGEARAAAERLEILHAMDRAILEAGSLEEMAGATLRRLRLLLGAPRAALALFDLEAGQGRWLAVDQDRETELGPGARFPLELMGDLGALRQGRAQVIEDVAALGPIPVAQRLLAEGVRSYIVLPLVARGELIGSLNFGSRGPGAFPEESVRIAREVADQLAVAIIQARLREEVRRHAEELERRVAERTAELQAANARLELEVAERRRAERALERHSQHLEEMVQQRTQQLLHAERLATLTELVAGVAHELNNPLSVVLGQAHLLGQQAGENPLAARAAKIGAAAERCARIVRNLLMLTRQHAPERRRVSVNEVARAAAELVAYQFRVAGVELRLELDEGLPQIWADPHQLDQVLVNLANNALHAVRGTAGPNHFTIRTEYDADRERVVITVSDSGPGIPPEHLPRIFEPFFTTKPPGEGTGLGLAICQGIIQAHGGSISVDSRSGQGTAFRIELPIGAPSGPAEAPPGPAAPAAPARRGTVLVVDDEAEIGAMLSDVLGADGHTVEVVRDGLEALERLAGRPYDLVITDLRMPGLDGPGLYEAIRARHPALAGRVVFITGDLVSQRTRQFLERTGAPFLPKPFDFGEARLLVQTLLEAGARSGEAPGARG